MKKRNGTELICSPTHILVCIRQLRNAFESSIVNGNPAQGFFFTVLLQLTFDPDPAHL